MQGTNVLFGQIAVVFGIVIAGVWGATPWTAAALGYQLRLGTLWFDVYGRAVEKSRVAFTQTSDVGTGAGHGAFGRDARKKSSPYAFLRKGLISFGILGSPNWVRTSDLRINSPSLYRLSYRGIKEAKL